MWMELSTPDVPAAREFYAALFGWTFAEPDRESGYVAALIDGQPVAGLIESAQETARWKVFLQVDDIAEAVGAVVRTQGRVLMSPLRLEGQGTQAIIESPAGAEFTLWQPEDFHGFTLGTSAGQPTWFELVSSKFDISLAFFHHVVGWEYHYVDCEGIMSTSAHEDARFATNGPRGHATAGVVDGRFETDPQWLSFFRSYVAVDDVEAVANVARELGATVGEARDTALGVAVEITDLQGATITAVEPKMEERG